MIVFGVVVAALIVAGTHAAGALWIRLDADAEETGPIERVTAGAVIGAALWIATSWILALTHSLTPAALWIAAGLAVAAAIVSVVRSGLAWVPVRWGRVALLLPVVLWTLFALWRGAVLPPASHDALSYHLPRAVMMARAAGFEHFPSPDARLNAYPANYELLLADVILMSGTDRLTEWASTVMFVLFLLAAAALAERWWRNTTSIVEVVLVTATTPLLLLHSSAHKNDVMTAVFAVTALLWGARWCARGGRMPMLLLGVSLVLGGGTKPQAAGVMLGLAPFLLARVFRELRAGRLRVGAIVLTGVLALAFFAVGGAAPYVMLVTQGGGPAQPSPFQWGDYENLWQAPILILAAPFSSNDLAVWVPWRGEYWFWPRYEIFFSNYGALFTVVVLLLPLAVYVSRRRRGEGARRERLIGTLAAVLAVAVLLPAEIRPVGFFASLGRYLLFIVPVVIAGTVPPLLDALRGSVRFQRLPAFLAAVLAVAFTLQAWSSAINDTFAPLEYARMAAALPGTRTVWFESKRAGSVVDRLAGPRDTIAVGGAFDTWIHPAYGADLTRPVILLAEDATASDVPAAAQWVIVDRSWNAIWSHPGLTDMGKFWQYIGHGSPTPADVLLYSQLLRDPRFRLVYHDPRLNQAVFWRIGSTVGRAPDEWRGPR